MTAPPALALRDAARLYAAITHGCGVRAIRILLDSGETVSLTVHAAAPAVATPQPPAEPQPAWRFAPGRACWRGVWFECRDQSHAILSALVDAGGEVVTDAELIDLAWDRDDETNTHAIEGAVSRLRSLLRRTLDDPPAIERQGGGYRID